MLKLRTWWETADRTQKAVTLFGGAFLVLLLGGTFYFASRPKMAMAYSGLNQADVGRVTQEIQKLGIPVEFDLQGNVKVPSDQVAEVQAKLAMSGAAPTSGTVGNEELSKLNLMIPPNVEQERLKSILEGELARSIQQIDGIAAARVHLTRGERSAFATEKKPASASIFITEKAGGAIGPESARAIAMMVTNAVTGLEPSRVFVLDNAGRPLYDGSEAASTSGQASQKIEAERTEAMRRERDIQAKLDSVIGRGNSVVTVNVEMNFDKQTKEQIEEKANGKPIVEESANEQVTKDGTTLNLDPSGLASNLGGTPTESAAGATSTGKPGYGGEKKYAQYPINRTITKTEPALGSLKTMAIAVLVNQDKVQDATPVEDFLKSYIGENPAFTANVTSIAFDKTAEEEAKKSAAAATSRDTMQQAMSLLPVIALLVVGCLVMKAIAKAAKSQTVTVHALADGSLALSGPQAPMPDGTHIHHTHQDGNTEAFTHALTPRTMEDVGEIEQRTNKPLEQLKRMSHDRPESVAMLLKSWLLEERR